MFFFLRASQRQKAAAEVISGSSRFPEGAGSQARFAVCGEGGLFVTWGGGAPLDVPVRTDGFVYEKHHRSHRRCLAFPFFFKFFSSYDVSLKRVNQRRRFGGIVLACFLVGSKSGEAVEGSWRGGGRGGDGDVAEAPSLGHCCFCRSEALTQWLLSASTQTSNTRL